LNTGAYFLGNRCLVPHVWHARSYFQRARGLLVRRPLAPDGSEGLLLEPCSSIHTMWMGYALDLMFLDEHDLVVGIASNVKPWRVRTHRGARKTLELRAGSLAVIHPRIGDQLTWQHA
jgi:uncharacterized protein